MPKTASPAPSTALTTNKSEAFKEHDKALKLLAPLEQEVGHLTIETEVDYLSADGLLGRIRQARKAWGGVWDRIQDKTIKPIRAGLDELYSLNRDVDGPLETLETQTKAAMGEFKRKEQKRLREAEDELKREAERLRREAEEKERAAQSAVSAQMRGRLQAAATRLKSQVEAVEQKEVAQPIKGSASSTRTIPTPTVVAWGRFIQGIAAGYIPDDVVVIDQAKLKRYYKDDPEGMKAWPGIEIVDEVQIVGR